MKEGSKQWWKTSSELLGAPSKIRNIPTLKDGDGNWVKDPGPKASLLAKTFVAKYKLAAKEQNEYSKIKPTGHTQEGLIFPTVDAAYRHLDALREDYFGPWRAGSPGLRGKRLSVCSI